MGVGKPEVTAEQVLVKGRCWCQFSVSSFTLVRHDACKVCCSRLLKLANPEWCKERSFWSIEQPVLCGEREDSICPYMAKEGLRCTWKVAGGLWQWGYASIPSLQWSNQLQTRKLLLKHFCSVLGPFQDNWHVGLGRVNCFCRAWPPSLVVRCWFSLLHASLFAVVWEC